MTRPLLALAVLLAAAACASRPAPAPIQETAPQATRPLASLVGQRVIVLPTHYLRGADSLGWAAGLDAKYLRTIDDEIAFTLAERGLRTAWVYPEALARSAKRAVTLGADPYALAAETLRPGATRKAMVDLPVALASQVRNLVALHDARFAIFPVEVRFEKIAFPPDSGAGAAAAAPKGRGVLRVVLLDARLARVIWVGDVHSESSAAFSPAIAASIASQFADLIAAP